MNKLYNNSNSLTQHTKIVICNNLEAYKKATTKWIFHFIGEF